MIVAAQGMSTAFEASDIVLLYSICKYMHFQRSEGGRAMLGDLSSAPCAAINQLWAACKMHHRKCDHMHRNDTWHCSKLPAVYCTALSMKLL